MVPGLPAHTVVFLSRPTLLLSIPVTAAEFLILHAPETDGGNSSPRSCALQGQCFYSFLGSIPGPW